MTALRAALLALCAAGVGFAVGTAWPGAQAPAAEPESQRQLLAAMDALRAEVASLRQAVGTASAAATTVVARPADTPSPAQAPAPQQGWPVARSVPPTQPGTATAAAAQPTSPIGSVVSRAINAGRWTDEDAAEFRRLAPGMTAAQREEAALRLAQAVNAQRVKLETD